MKIPTNTWDTRWRHQMETFSALLAICAWDSPVPGEFPAQRPMKRSFDVFFDLRLNKRLSKQSWGWWIEALSRPLWRHCSETVLQCQSYWVLLKVQVAVDINPLFLQKMFLYLNLYSLTSRPSPAKCTLEISQIYSITCAITQIEYASTNLAKFFHVRISPCI